MAVDPSHVNPLDCEEVSEQCPVEASIYGYYPILEWNTFFVALFGVCFIVHVVLGWRFRTWTYMLAMTLACLAACIGYIGRCLMHNNPFNITGFQIQICCLTLSPALNSAAIYLILKHIVLQFGREWSRIRPKYYTWAFITADLFALVLQAAGGAIAATAGDDDNFRDVGDRLMITGISWQVLTLLIFEVATTDYIIRRLRSPKPLSTQAFSLLHNTKFRIFIGAFTTAYISIFIRCVYRIAEMANGWRNPIMQNQPLFIGIESCLVALATVLQTLAHPGYFFPALADYRKTKRANRVQEEMARDESVEQKAVVV
ncbi:uncharacterized protein Z518_00309 [Rhinocladiella mackenziei CBS 650.93]|uniref:RTA1 domain protein n=1 Tax=Rhinocladiella mackenziei CBS 650.93 TaxID=1442369 RepID=A0A0D2JIH5_9EURO|nr:uncharacterized protein Z518_00309 [Rhinocladiella mackenziei CBS 650.93]KIX09230.1 hypothetical protein Z518_00309 [Rhinocladiella mackenziei CBS 650.93]